MSLVRSIIKYISIIHFFNVVDVITIIYKLGHQKIWEKRGPMIQRVIFFREKEVSYIHVTLRDKNVTESCVLYAAKVRRQRCPLVAMPWFISSHIILLQFGGIKVVDLPRSPRSVGAL
jgi:hypothetical protein